MPEGLRRLGIVMPTWLGDCVMATPFLRAVRRGLPEASVTLVAKPAVLPVLEGLPYFDDTIASDGGVWATAREMRRRRFEACVLLPGSFRWAAVAWLAGVPVRIGYRRDGRGFLLTDGPTPAKVDGKYVPTPTLRYYLKLLEPLGVPEAGRRMELTVTPTDEAKAAAILRSAGLADANPLVIFVPGANYGAAKLWPPAHFATLADRLASEHGASIACSVAPAERFIAAEIDRLAETPVVDLAAHGLTLPAVKAICRRADLVVSNDTGTRHVAAAVGAKLVTLFGPTDPKWTTIDHPRERELSIPVPCGPCQLKVCPLQGADEKQCLHGLTPEMVFVSCIELLGAV